MKSQRGGITTNVLLILIFASACALFFMKFRGDFKNSGTTTTMDSPTISQRVQAKKTAPVGEFTDGLGTPDTITHGTLDEFGAGIESIAEFNRDINNDGQSDRITRTHVATGNAHDYDEYAIELNNNGAMHNITPKGFRTTHGADCALRLIQFHFAPTFGVTIISRPFVDTWDTPSMATKTEYYLENNKLVNSPATKLSNICDVRDLF